MSPLVIALIVLGGLVVVATAIGLLVKAREGRVREVHGLRKITAAELDTKERFGDFATLVQFSTEYCTKCPGTHALLQRTAEKHVGVRHIEIDLTHRPDIASAFNILQTPTTLVLDEIGTIAARIGGAPRPDAVETALGIALRRDHGQYVI